MKKNTLGFFLYFVAVLVWSYFFGVTSGIEASKPLPLSEVNIYHEHTDTDKLEGNTQVVKATYYDYFLDGIAWSKQHNTCAVKNYPRYSTLLVKNITNGKTVECFVNDYGPMSCDDRIKNGLDTPTRCIERGIDLSSHAFKQLADTKLGIIDVEVSLKK